MTTFAQVGLRRWSQIERNSIALLGLLMVPTS